MSDLRDALERERRRFKMPDESREDLEHRRDTRRRNRRIASGVVAFAVAAVGTFAAFAAFRETERRPRPAVSPPLVVSDRVPPPSSTVQFVDSNHGWIALNDLVLVTRDGGRTWTQQDVSSVRVPEIQFVDEDHGWVVSPEDLLRTRDGGHQWSPLKQLTPPLRQIQFLDQNLGWGIRGGRLAEGVPPDEPPNAIVRTTDGGATWQIVGTPSDVIDSICFVADGTGWAASGPTVFHTTNAGESWKKTSLEIRDVQGVEGGGWTGILRCSSETDAWVQLTDGGAAGHIAYAVFHTSDGANWAPVLQEAGTSPLGRDANVYASEDPYPGPFDIPTPGAASFLNFCPPCGETSALTRTLDGGATWERFDLPQDVHGGPIGLSFIDRDNGWAAISGTLPSAQGETSNVFFLKTSDGGETWSMLGIYRLS
jgi:photosystem II stability/assembly factor-like uncharacterized protein